MPNPTVGRIVHYRSGNACLAAVVAKIDEQEPARIAVLHVIVPSGAKTTSRERDVRANQDWAADPGTANRTWHWPEREDDE